MIKNLRVNKPKKITKKKVGALLTATGVTAGLLAALSRFNEDETPKYDGVLSADAGKLYLVDVLDEEKKIMVKDIDGNELNYKFDEDTVAVIGAKNGKTEKGKEYEVMLVDGNSNITYGYMDGKYLDDKYFDTITVSNTDFDTYYVSSPDGVWLRPDTEIDEYSQEAKLLESNYQVLGSVSSVSSDSNAYSWNEVLLVSNKGFTHGYVVNDYLSNTKLNETEVDEINEDCYYVGVNVLNVRKDHSTEGEESAELGKGHKVRLVEGIESYNDGKYEWVYITYEDKITHEQKNGWVAAVNYTQLEPIYYLVDKSAYKKITEEDLDLINSQSAIIFDTDTEKVLYEKNAFDEMEPASITKILTAYIVSKYGNLDDKLTYTRNAVNVDGHLGNGYGVGASQAKVKHIVKEGTVISVKDALHISLLLSCNSTTVALQDYIESITGRNFEDIMNEEARNMGCTKTNFTNSFGYADKAHLVSAYDMAKIATHIIKNSPEVIETMGTVEYALEYDGTIINHQSSILNPAPNNGYYNSSAIGCKTGYTKSAGQTMVTIYSKNDKTFIVVTLNGKGTDSKYDDTSILSRYAFAQIEENTNMANLSSNVILEQVNDLEEDVKVKKIRR